LFARVKKWAPAADRRFVNLRLRVPALVGLGALAVGLGGFVVLGRGPSSSAAPVHAIKPLHPVKKHLQAKAPLAPPKVSLARKSKVKAKATPKGRPAVIAGVPTPLATGLKQHAVVVVALVTPQSTVDQLTLAEARAGAAGAHVGFVTIDVSNNLQVAALSALIGSSADPQNRLLDAPAVLVFQRPASLYLRFNGYADADTIQQAAVNAASAAPSS
jgi:hypothetical protein